VIPNTQNGFEDHVVSDANPRCTERTPDVLLPRKRRETRDTSE